MNDLTFNQDGSISSARITTYVASCAGKPNFDKAVTDIFFQDNLTLYPNFNTQQRDNMYYNRSLTHSALAQGLFYTDTYPQQPIYGAYMQASSAHYNGHGYDHVVPIQTAIATQFSTTDIDAMIASWQASGTFPQHVGAITG